MPPSSRPLRSVSRVPAYTLHKASGRAVVRLGGKDHYLGLHGTAESEAAYERTIATWLANGRQLPGSSREEPYAIGDLADDFLAWCDREYRAPDGTVSKSVVNDEVALRPLVTLFCDLPVSEFGPKSLVLLRQRLIDGIPDTPPTDAKGKKRWKQKPLSRSTVNDRVAIVRRAFKWGVAEEKVPPSVFHGLLSVTGLKRGRCGAREAPPVTCVPEAHIEKALPFMPPPVAAMVELQLLTAARPGEIVLLRLVDLDRTGPVWLYKPPAHKNAWRGHERTIPIGPKGQEILRRFLRPAPPETFLFSPTEAERRRRERLRASRVTPLYPSHVRALSRKRRAAPRRCPRDHYDVITYARAIRRACGKAKVPVWSPGRLRHNAATEARRRFGLEAASALLGHRLVETTQIYAEMSRTRALEIAANVG